MQLPPLEPARLVSRPNRFVLEVELEADCARERIHCPNTGSLMGLSSPGNRIWLSRSANPARKYSGTLELIEAEGTLVGVNTLRPNRIAEEALGEGLIADLPRFVSIRREVAYDEGARIDLLSKDARGHEWYVEVKNCHLVRRPGLAEFPDSVTARGTKHLFALERAISATSRALLMFVVQRNDVVRFSPASDLDPAYARAFQQAGHRGVEIRAFRCHVSTSEIKIDVELPIVE